MDQTDKLNYKFTPNGVVQDSNEVAGILGQMLREIVKALHLQFKKQFHQFAGGKELTVPQIFVLRHLMQHGPSAISALADSLNLANSTISGIVDRLERDGLVYRVRDNADRRIVHVELTERAEFLRDKVPAFQEKFLSELLSGTDEKTLQDMLRSLHILYDLIQRVEENGRDK